MANEAASQFVGGPDFQPTAIAADSSGNTYVVGQVAVTQEDGSKSSDIQLFEFNPQFEPVFQRSYGGSSYDSPSAMVMGGDGNLYLTGSTSSGDFPAMNPVQSQFGGEQDVFLMQLSPDGEILFSTVYGGSSQDSGSQIAVDEDGNAYIAGRTLSSDFPVTPGAYISEDPLPDAGPADYRNFVLQIATNPPGVTYSTWFGGGPQSIIRSIAIASGGDLFVLRSPTNGSTQDGSSTQFFGRLSADGSTMVSQTNLDLSDGYFNNIVLGKDGNPVLAGSKLVFLDAATSQEISRVDLIGGVPFLGAVDAEGNLFFYGFASGFNPTPGGFSSGDNLLMKTTSDGTEILFLSAMPQQSADAGIVVDGNGYIHVLGQSGLLSRILPGENTAAMQGLPRILGIANAAVNNVTPKVAPGEILSLYGPAIGADQAMFAQVGSDGLVTTTLGGVEVRFNGTAGPLLYAGPNQINVTAPFALSSLGPNDAVLVEVVKDGTTWASLTMHPVDADPGVFDLGNNSNVLNQDYSVNSYQNPADAGSVGIFYMTGAGLLTGAAYQDGQIFDPTTPVADLPSTKLPVEITSAASFANQSLEILYAGQAPGMLAGVIQVNFRAPTEQTFTDPHTPNFLRLKVGDGSGSILMWIIPSEQ